MEVPSVVHDKKCGCSVAASAAESGGNWDVLVEADFHPLLDLKCLL